MDREGPVPKRPRVRFEGDADKRFMMEGNVAEGSITEGGAAGGRVTRSMSNGREKAHFAVRPSTDKEPQMPPKRGLLKRTYSSTNLAEEYNRAAEPGSEPLCAVTVHVDMTGTPYQRTFTVESRQLKKYAGIVTDDHLGGDPGGGAGSSDSRLDIILRAPLDMETFRFFLGWLGAKDGRTCVWREERTDTTYLGESAENVALAWALGLQLDCPQMCVDVLWWAELNLHWGDLPMPPDARLWDCMPPGSRLEAWMCDQMAWQLARRDPDARQRALGGLPEEVGLGVAMAFARLTVRVMNTLQALRGDQVGGDVVVSWAHWVHMVDRPHPSIYEERSRSSPSWSSAAFNIVSSGGGGGKGSSKGRWKGKEPMMAQGSVSNAVNLDWGEDPCVGGVVSAKIDRDRSLF